MSDNHGQHASQEEAKRAVDAIQPESASGSSSSDAAQYDPNVGHEAGGESEASKATHAGSEGNETLAGEKGGND